MGLLFSFIFGMIVGAILICVIAVIYGKGNEDDGHGEG